MRHLPIIDDSILDRIGIARPCDADWSAMKGDDQVRFCGSCRQNVYDIASMTRAEATLLLRHREKKPCLRLLRRSDGRLVTEDCRERLRKARARGVRAFAIALVLVGVSQLVLRLAGVASLWSLVRKTPSGPDAIAPAGLVVPAIEPPTHATGNAVDHFMLGEIAAPSPGTEPHDAPPTTPYHRKAKSLGKPTLHRPSVDAPIHHAMGGVGIYVHPARYPQ